MTSSIFMLHPVLLTEMPCPLKGASISEHRTHGPTLHDTMLAEGYTLQPSPTNTSTQASPLVLVSIVFLIDFSPFGGRKNQFTYVVVTSVTLTKPVLAGVIPRALRALVLVLLVLEQ